MADAMADATVKILLDRYGRTYADEAGIRLADRPAPLCQLLVLATLLSARITAGVAVAAARELFRAGYRTPAAMVTRPGRTGSTRSAAATTAATTNAPPPCSATRLNCASTAGTATCGACTATRTATSADSADC